MHKQILFAVAVVVSSCAVAAPGMSQIEPVMPRQENAGQRPLGNVSQPIPDTIPSQLGQEAGSTNAGPIDDDPWIKFCFYNVPAEELDDCINGLPSIQPLGRRDGSR